MNYNYICESQLRYKITIKLPYLMHMSYQIMEALSPQFQLQDHLQQLLKVWDM